MCQRFLNNTSTLWQNSEADSIDRTAFFAHIAISALLFKKFILIFIGDSDGITWANLHANPAFNAFF